ncbi:CheW protein [Chondrocystis sp. NIES-4102]|nr:CheW protein [Chondrocystis sp. NIES-4102]
MSSLTTTDRLKELLPQLFNTQEFKGNNYLRFELTAEIIALIDLQYVQESLTINNDEITVVPNLPEYVMGLMSSHNQVFLAIDLAHLMGFAPTTVNLRQYQAIVIQDTSQMNLWGFTVKRVLGISRYQSEQFTSVNIEIPENLRPFVQKTVIESSSQGSNFSATNHSFLLDLTKLISTKISQLS